MDAAMEDFEAVIRHGYILPRHIEEIVWPVLLTLISTPIILEAHNATYRICSGFVRWRVNRITQWDHDTEAVAPHALLIELVTGTGIEGGFNTNLPQYIQCSVKLQAIIYIDYNHSCHSRMRTMPCVNTRALVTGAAFVPM